MRKATFVIPALAAIAVGGSLRLEAGPSARLAQARYIAIGYNVGTGIVGELDVSPEVLPEEREAARRIHDSIRSWGRYVVVDRATQADVLLTLRKGRLGSVGGGGIWGFDVDFGYTPKFFGDIPGIDNNLLTVMADVSAGPSITSRSGRGVRPYVNFGIGLVHTKFGSSSDNNFAWNAGGGVTAMFSSNVGIRGEARYTRTVNNDSFSDTISLSDGGFHFWRATIGLVIQ